MKLIPLGSKCNQFCKDIRPLLSTINPYWFHSQSDIRVVTCEWRIYLSNQKIWFLSGSSEIHELEHYSGTCTMMVISRVIWCQPGRQITGHYVWSQCMIRTTKLWRNHFQERKWVNDHWSPGQLNLRQARDHWTFFDMQWSLDRRSAEYIEKGGEGFNIFKLFGPHWTEIFWSTECARPPRTDLSHSLPYPPNLQHLIFKRITFIHYNRI